MAALGAKVTSAVRFEQAQISVANTNRDGTGTTVKIVDGHANGSRLKLLRVKAEDTTTAGMVRLFISPDGGTTKRLIAEIAVSAITPSATVATFVSDWTIPDEHLLVDASHEIYASTHNAETFTVMAVIEDY